MHRRGGRGKGELAIIAYLTSQEGEGSSLVAWIMTFHQLIMDLCPHTAICCIKSLPHPHVLSLLPLWLASCVGLKDESMERKGIQEIRAFSNVCF